MIRNGNIIKHKYFLDAAFVVHSFKRYSPNYYTIKGEWINQGFDASWALGIKQTLKIPNHKISEWLICTEPLATCVRYAQWRVVDVSK